MKSWNHQQFRSDASFCTDRIHQCALIEGAVGDKNGICPASEDRHVKIAQTPQLRNQPRCR